MRLLWGFELLVLLPKVSSHRLQLWNIFHIFSQKMWARQKGFDLGYHEIHILPAGPHMRRVSIKSATMPNFNFDFRFFIVLFTGFQFKSDK